MSESQRSRAEAGVEPLEREIEKNLLIQEALDSILRISLESISLDEQLHRVLDLILKLPWLALEAQGCIFLVDGDSRELVMQAHIGMPAGVLSTCSRVPFGSCLCGRAIASSDILYARCFDERHTTRYPGILPHGHYCVPIASGERRIGLLNLYVREGHRQLPVEEQFLRAVADVLAGIIERQRTQERLQEQLRLAAFGRDVGLAMSQSDRLPDMLRQCAEALVRHLDGAFARIWTLNEAENVLELQASAGLYTHTDGAHRRVHVGRYKIGLIAQERKPHLSNAILGDPRVHDQEWARREGLVAFAGYPLLVGDRLVGVMALFARRPLSEATLDTMASVANKIAVGIERLQLGRAVRELAAIVQSSDDAIIGKTLDGVIWSWNLGAQRLYGYSAEEVRGQPIALLLPPDHPDELPGIMDKLQRGERIDHYETVRVRKDGKRVEVSVSISPIQDATGAIVGASAIARDITERRQSERRLAAEHAVSQILAVSSALGDAASAILRAICDSLDWDGGLVWEVDRKARVLRCVEVWHRPALEVPAFEQDSRQRTYAPGLGLPGRVWAEETLAWVPDLAAEADLPRAPLAAREGLHGAVGFPVRNAVELLGVVEFYSRDIRPPDDELIQMMTSIGYHISQFIERRRAEGELHRQEHDRRTGREIQQELLPKAVPRLPGFNLGGRSAAANDVGGDCFDFIPLGVGDEECLGVLVADASGHGIAAALLVAQTRAYLRALALTCADVGTLLTLSNQRLASDLVTDHFVTLFLLRLDPRTHSLRYANAGHWPGYVLDRQGQTRAVLASTGCPLGIDPTKEFPPGPPTTLEPGELVLLFTDGIVEAASAEGGRFGLERTLGIVRAHRHETPDAILDALFDAVSAFSGHSLQDDITAVILKAEGVP